MKKITAFGALITLLVLGAGCKKVLEAYLGIPLQPENLNSVYEPGLNVFGILKTGASVDSMNHYFEVQRIQYVFDTDTTLNINNATINVTCQKSGNLTLDYLLEPYGEGKYTNPLLVANSGERWDFQCVYDTFLIKASTLIPNEPIIREGSINIENSKVSFVIEPDTSAFLYDIYLLYGSNNSYKRIVPEAGIGTEVELDVVTGPSGEEKTLIVIAYDYNYESYVTTSNIFFKPNAYRPRFTTVEGGYGCFCSSHSILVEL